MPSQSEIHHHFLWATKQILNLLQSMTDEEFSQKPSWNGRAIRESILHLVSVNAYFSSPDSYSAIIESSKHMDKNELLHTWSNLTNKIYDIFENDPKKTIPVKTKQGLIKNISGIDLLYMLTDHFSYHRGQIITTFKAITGKEGTGTDFARYLMEDEPDYTLPV